LNFQIRSFQKAKDLGYGPLVRIAALADVLKVILYVVASFALAAVISPYLYELGKGFAHVTLSKDTADEVNWLAEKAGKAEFDTYFKRSLLISALVCLVPFFYSLDLRRHPRKRRGNPWSVGLPPNTAQTELGQPLRKTRWGILHTLAGFCITTGFFFMMSWFLFKLNWFEWDCAPNRAPLLESIGKAIGPSLGVSFLEEVFFRGALLGIFLRAFRPRLAIVFLSVIFASTHFLTPPPDTFITSPSSAMAGFEMLALIGQKFLQLDTIIHSFIALLLVGVILGIARYSTASLWLPIGLHAGWVFSMKMFGRMAERRPDFPDEFNLYMGKNMTEGLIPIGVLVMTGIIVVVYLRILLPKTPLELSE
jgi:membrane protease YdiL (CAAX protease family)